MSTNWQEWESHEEHTFRRRQQPALLELRIEGIHREADDVLLWPDSSFTAATCMSAFEVFPDPAKVLAEVFRVLRPGGRAVLTIGGTTAAGHGD